MRGLTARVGTPMPAGNEGAGTVVAAGSSEAAQRLLGKKVAAAGDGMYSQYRTVEVSLCLELPEGLPAADGASAFVNPMTALAMIDTMRMEDHVALVHTAAASNLGQMLDRLCQEEEVPLVSIVRRAGQEDLLRAAGAAFVCDSSKPGFMDELTAALTATGATLAFDATGGGMLASQILTCMEASASAGADGYSRYGSAVHKQVCLYGGLDRSPTVLTRSFGMAWGVGGWLLTPFLGKIGLEGTIRLRDHRLRRSGNGREVPDQPAQEEQQHPMWQTSWRRVPRGSRRTPIGSRCSSRMASRWLRITTGSPCWRTMRARLCGAAGR